MMLTINSGKFAQNDRSSIENTGDPVMVLHLNHTLFPISH